MTGLARRIQWLMPDAQREVYSTGRSGGGSICFRCGNRVPEGEVNFQVRDRGTKWQNQQRLVIHRKCIPDPKQFTGTAGLPARRVPRREAS